MFDTVINSSQTLSELIILPVHKGSQQTHVPYETEVTYFAGRSLILIENRHQYTW